jgi:hypothetical protein
MDAGEQLAAKILDAIRSGRDLYVFDRFIKGPDRLESARKVLIEKRDACSDPDEADFLTSVIRRLKRRRLWRPPKGLTGTACNVVTMSIWNGSPRLR